MRRWRGGPNIPRRPPCVGGLTDRIPFNHITAWRAEAPWVDDSQVEQDLVISRALVEIFSHPMLATHAGTAR